MSRDLLERRRVVGVMGSGTESYKRLAEPLGCWIAEHGFNLLTGGGGGAMLEVSKAFFQTENRRGNVLAILPGEITESHYKRRSGYPNPWVEIAIFTHLPLWGAQGEEPMSRNHINVLTSDVIVALPGGEGTASEVRLALKYRRPIVAFLGDEGTIPELPECVVAVRENRLDRVGQFILDATKEWPVPTFSLATIGLSKAER